MTVRRRFADWLDVRPAEIRLVLLSFAGAFFLMSFLALTKALRRGFYLGHFDASTLPYIKGASVVLGIVAASLLTRVVTRVHPQTAFRHLILWIAAGVAFIVPFIRIAESTDSVWAVTVGDATVVAFFLWTGLGSLLLASGFWLVVSELFAVREAKRLFGLVSAGGTLGTLVSGLSVSFLVERLATVALIPVLLAVLLGSLIVNELTPRSRLHVLHPEADRQLARAPATVWNETHLRIMALIVLAMGVASELVDFQFQEMAQRTFQVPGDLEATSNRLSGFFGAFEGWAGGLAFAVQILITSRLLTGAGVSWSLAVLPLGILFGSVGMLAAPGIIVATVLRGTDVTFRKSLFRSVMEFLWVPIPVGLRRRAKTFIDSLVDNVGEGLGAAIVFLWVTLSGFPSRYLSVFVILTVIGVLWLSRRMGLQYFATLRQRLDSTGRAAENLVAEARLDQRDLLGATITRLDITRVLAAEGIMLGDRAVRPAATPREREAEREPDLAEILVSGDSLRISRALEETPEWDPVLAPHLTRLIARDRLMERAVKALISIGPAAVPHLARVLADEHADFVIRRRVPRVLAAIDDQQADEALVGALEAGRFEIRYRAALALQRRRRDGLRAWHGDWQGAVWRAIRAEVSRERPVWELARLLDGDPEDILIERRVGVRGELSLEHTFRLLSLVLEPEAMRTAYRGIVLSDAELNSFALEYLEQVLPPDVRLKLWPFIGDLSESQERRAIRRLDDVVSDLLQTGRTLFASEESRQALRRVLQEDAPRKGPRPPREEAGGGSATEPDESDAT